MNDSPDGFLEWATASDRTVEELFGLERFVEQGLDVWDKVNGHPTYYDRGERCRAARKRMLNPAYRPEIPNNDLEVVAEILNEVTHLCFGSLGDRPLRDLSVLRFCPNLKTLRCSLTRICDWSFVTSLERLEQLVIMDLEARDFSLVGDLAALRELSMHVYHPWPEFSGFERLGELRQLIFHGNLLALSGIPELPGLRSAQLVAFDDFKVPLRRVADLPAMPELRRLTLDSTMELDGIEKFPRLLNLDLRGRFTDLTPLGELADLTHLRLADGDYPGLQPLAGLARLNRIIVSRELPPDLTPLAELPRLHEIRVEGSPVTPPELASLNALCAPWKDEFGVVPPRSLAPLKLMLREAGERYDPAKDTSAEPRDWSDNHEMGLSEDEWFRDRVTRRLNKLLGKGWKTGPYPIMGRAGHLMISLSRTEDIDRLPAIAQALRKLIASARYPWHFHLIADSLADYGRDFGEEDATPPDPDKFDAEAERRNWEEARQARLTYQQDLKRRYEHRLGEELGINPPAVQSEPEEENEDEPEEFHDETDDDPGYDLGTRLRLDAHLGEHTLSVQANDRGLAEMLFELGEGEEG